MYISYNRNCSS